jgi:hypothetical protein
MRDLIRFAHNWNTGMMEQWVIGKIPLDWEGVHIK